MRAICTMRLMHTYTTPATVPMQMAAQGSTYGQPAQMAAIPVIDPFVKTSKLQCPPNGCTVLTLIPRTMRTCSLAYPSLVAKTADRAAADGAKMVLVAARAT